MTERDTVVDQIKDALDIVDVVQETASLTQLGDEWVGSHPTHASDSGRSLNVNSKKQVWQCWNCGAKGDVLDWIADANGLDIKSQFQQVLEIAAQKAGIELDRGDPEAWSEMQEIRAFYTAVAEYYHSNLKEEHRAAIRDQWGITDDTIDDLKIGISKTTGDALYRDMVQVFDQATVEKSGLVRRTTRGWMDRFIGRIIFPYWYNGQVVYFIARQSKWTPKNKYESGKYKKLQTKDDKNDYVSPQVENRYLYGMDSTRGVNDRLVITEGVTDCIAVLNGGMACISPVTTKFRKVDCVRLLKIAKRFNKVFVCNDTDKAGVKGSIQTTEYLIVNGVDAKIVRLPVEDDDKKMDIAEYLRTHEFEEFTQLFDDAVSVWERKLAEQDVPADVMSSARKAKSFVTGELVRMDPMERVVFVESGVKDHYGLSDAAVAALLKDTDEAFQKMDSSKTAPSPPAERTPRQAAEGQYEVMNFDLFRKLVARYPESEYVAVDGTGVAAVYTINGNDFIKDALELEAIKAYTADDGNALVITCPEELHAFIGGVEARLDGENTVYYVTIRDQRIEFRAEEVIDLSIWRKKAIYACKLVISFDLRKHAIRDTFNLMIADIIDRAEVVWEEKYSIDDVYAQMIMTEIDKMITVDARVSFARNPGAILCEDNVRYVKSATIASIHERLRIPYGMEKTRIILAPYLARSSQRLMINKKRYSCWIFKSDKET